MTMRSKNRRAASSFCNQVERLGWSVPYGEFPEFRDWDEAASGSIYFTIYHGECLDDPDFSELTVRVADHDSPTGGHDINIDPGGVYAGKVRDAVARVSRITAALKDATITNEEDLSNATHKEETANV